MSDGKLTITVGSGALDAKICFVEIGPVGTSVDAGVMGRVNDLVQKATDATWETPTPVNATREYVYGSYVDEPVMMVTGASTKHYFHQNHLYSVAAMTNSAGAVVERYRYDAYGKRTVTSAAGTPIAASTIGQQRGFTGYHLDAETGLYYARNRMYSAGLGRFVSRDPINYLSGLSLYMAYMVPYKVDPYGLKDIFISVNLDPDGNDKKGDPGNGEYAINPSDLPKDYTADDVNKAIIDAANDANAKNPGDNNVYVDVYAHGDESGEFGPKGFDGAKALSDLNKAGVDEIRVHACSRDKEPAGSGPLGKEMPKEKRERQEKQKKADDARKKILDKIADSNGGNKVSGPLGPDMPPKNAQVTDNIRKYTTTGTGKGSDPITKSGGYK